MLLFLSRLQAWRHSAALPQQGSVQNPLRRVVLSESLSAFAMIFCSIEHERESIAQIIFDALLIYFCINFLENRMLLSS